MNPYLSIIIPIYKVEAFVGECLDSVFRQLPEGVEVLVIDDGSPDGSMDIVRRDFQPWIELGVMVLLAQPNAGPGAARNLGLAHARGRYIGFLDSDDVLLDGYFAELIDRLGLGLADIIEFGFKRFRDSSMLESEPQRRLYPFSGLKKLADVREQVFARTRWYPSLRVYRREVLAGFRFPEAVHYEDTISLPTVFLGSWFIQYLDKPLLGYRERPGSITSSHSLADLDTLYGFYRSIAWDADPALQVLKVSLARTLSYFHRELAAADFPMAAVLAEIKDCRLPPDARKALTWPDYLFYRTPQLYMMLNAIRLHGDKNRKVIA